MLAEITWIYEMDSRDNMDLSVKNCVAGNIASCIYKMALSRHNDEKLR